ncbi:hypothetical protein F4678DRAFT_438823 [Xylaria arbuscula]|nr:hypothetical protein F4678DRAFT_438823 [Xylaria arbuscula]
MSSLAAAIAETELPRACDRCHSIKERCEWVPNENKCERCLRLRHVCETVRQKGRPGRKPGVQGKQLVAGIKSVSKSRGGRADDDRLLANLAKLKKMHRSGCVATITRSVSEFDFGDISDSDQHLVQKFLFDDRFLDMFSVAPSLTEKVRRQIIPHMLLSKTTFLDGFLACAISWAGAVDQDQENPRRLNACYRHASSAISKLISLQVSDFQAMIDCLMLGALVSSFTVKWRLHDTSAVCSRTLGLIEPIYARSDPGRPELRVFSTCMVIWELRACLFSCTAPTLRFKPPLEAYVDRHAGLSGTLLPLFYDICKLSYVIALCKTTGLATGISGELDIVEQSVRRWQPAVPEDLTTRFTTIEVAHMLCQAHVMHTAALLVIHRLKYPFGVNDGPAQVLSMSILSQVEMTTVVTKLPLRCVEIALMVACIELKENERQKWLSGTNKFSASSPEFRHHVHDTLRSYWALIDTSDTISWNGLVSLGTPFLRNQK